MKITIDLRLLQASGIGVYLQNVVPRLVRLRSGDRFCFILAPGEKIPSGWGLDARFESILCRAPVYSLAQQAEMPAKIPRDTDLLWIPHFDIPVFYRGKMMVTVHDLFHLAMPETVGGFHKRLYARWMFIALAI
jgi:hypothetical protein